MSDPDAFEILRLWGADGDQHVNIKRGLWDDPGHWGVMLADLARHAAKMFEQDDGLKIADSLQRIRESFLIELNHPTTDITSHERH